MDRKEKLMKLVNNSNADVIIPLIDKLLFLENQLEQLSDKRLDKEKLCKESKRKIKAYKLQPVCQKCDEMKTGIVSPPFL